MAHRIIARDRIAYNASLCGIIAIFDQGREYLSGLDICSPHALVAYLLASGWTYDNGDMLEQRHFLSIAKILHADILVRCGRTVYPLQCDKPLTVINITLINSHYLNGDELTGQ